MNYIECKSTIAAPLHLVPSREEPAHSFKDVLVDATVCLAPRTIAKVVGPASQRPVQLVTHFRPWVGVARHQKIADLCLEPLHTLLGRACTQVPFPVRLKQMRAERVAEEVEAFLSGVLVFASLIVNPSLVITAFVHANASAARPRLRITKSSA